MALLPTDNPQSPQGQGSSSHPLANLFSHGEWPRLVVMGSGKLIPDDSAIRSIAPPWDLPPKGCRSTQKPRPHPPRAQPGDLSP